MKIITTTTTTTSSYKLSLPYGSTLQKHIISPNVNAVLIFVHASGLK
jgi:hypothetical protein